MTVRLVALFISATSVASWIVWRQIRAGSRKRRSVSVQQPISPIMVASASSSSGSVFDLDKPPEETPLRDLADSSRDDLRMPPSSLPELKCDESVDSASFSGTDNVTWLDKEPAPLTDQLEVLAQESQSSGLQSADSYQSSGYEGSTVINSNSLDVGQESPESTSRFVSLRSSDILSGEFDLAEPSLLLDAAEPIGEGPLLPTNGDAPSQNSRNVALDDAPRKLPRYRPPSQKSRNTNQRADFQPGLQRKESTWLQHDIVVHITFDPHDFCAIRLLPVHTSELDETVSAHYPGGSLELVAQEDWYQDLSLEKIASYLRDSVELKAILENRQRVRWTLKGRDVYVLASHPDASGYISTNRLVLGRSHLVLCVEEQIETVQKLLQEAGCESYARLDQSSGVPEEWILFRGVTPTRSIALEEGTDPYYALKPAPDLQIELKGGIRIRNSEWLVGYPPQIKLFGEISNSARVFIDGVEAERLPDGTIVTVGYDSPGHHSVFCEGLSLSRSYSIETAPASWEMWPAHRFGIASICGPLVQRDTDAAATRMICVPTSNPLLIGAKPGQVFRCAARNVNVWKGPVPFDAVWALPAHPLICKKATARIIQLADLSPQYGVVAGRTELNWSNAVLDAARKGLLIESRFPDSASVWAAYKDVARSIRKRARR